MPTGLSSTSTPTATTYGVPGPVAAARRAVVDVGHLLRFRASTVRRRRALPTAVGDPGWHHARRVRAADVPPGRRSGVRSRPRRAAGAADGLRGVPVAHRGIRRHLGWRPRAAVPRAGRGLSGESDHGPSRRAADGAAERRVAAAVLGAARQRGLRAGARRGGSCDGRDPALAGRLHGDGADDRVDHGGDPTPATRAARRPADHRGLRGGGGDGPPQGPACATCSTTCPPWAWWPGEPRLRRRLAHRRRLRGRHHCRGGRPRRRTGPSRRPAPAARRGAAGERPVHPAADAAHRGRHDRVASTARRCGARSPCVAASPCWASVPASWRSSAT